MKKQGQNGFTAVEIVLSVALVGAIGVAGYFAYQNSSSHQQATASPTATASPAPSASPTPKPSATASPAPVANDNDLLLASVRTYEGVSTSAACPTISSVVIVGTNAQGQAGCATAGASGSAFYAHKTAGSWVVYIETQDQLCSDLGKKYSLPSEWYVTTCATTVNPTH